MQGTQANTQNKYALFYVPPTQETKEKLSDIYTTAWPRAIVTSQAYFQPPYKCN